MKQSNDELARLLTERWQYQPQQALHMVGKLNGMDQALQAAFEGYLQSGQFPEKPVFFGLNAAAIAGAYPFKPPAVFTCLDWIRRDPQAALDALVDEYKKPLPGLFDAKEYNAFIKAHKETAA